ncbi:MAG: S8 family serine peptidase, partial [Gammaproteobacteria bacterium]|nr:S8 family serine peptidase [Gammaproteobacteria bacterium]
MTTKSSNKKSYQIGGSMVSLVCCTNKYVIRTQSGVHPFEIVSTCLPNLVCDDARIVDHYPEADVWVYQIPSESSINVTEIKERVRALDDDRLVFIGSVWQDEISQRYQLYTGNLFVQFNQRMSKEQCQQKLSIWGLKLKQKLGFGYNTYFVEPFEEMGFDAFDWSTELISKKEVLLCQPELVVSRRTLTFDDKKGHTNTVLNRKWIHNRIELDRAWEFSKGKGVRICIIDDGIDVDHPAFSGKNKIFAAKDMLDRKNNGATHKHPSEIHGTACASVAGSADYRAFGIAPECQLIIVRTKGFGSVLEAEAISWAVAMGADVISCSWGPSDGDIDDPGDDLPSLPMPSHTKMALEHAAKSGRNGKGCLIVFAAGNGREAVALDSYASCPNVIAVGACNKDDNLTRYSDRGEPLFCVFPSSELETTELGYKTKYGVTVADRTGLDGYCDGDYFSLFGGTSAAAPGVAGVAALVLSANPNISLGDLKNILANSCEKIGDLSSYDQQGVSANYGHGLLNARLAVENARSFKPTDPTLKAVDDTKIKFSRNNRPGDPYMDNFEHSTQARGFALHVGVDVADPSVYEQFNELSGCVNDAKALAKITNALGFDVVSLHNQDARRQRIKSQMIEFAHNAKAGDLVLMTYAGHGSYVDDTTETANQDEPIDEVLVTYDGLLIDDEINSILCKFASGVRVVWIADCCHAATNARNDKVVLQGSGIASNSREISMVAANRVLNNKKLYYQNIQRDLNRNSKSTIQAAVLGLYACTETQQAQEFNGRGAFTQRIEELIQRFSFDYQLDELLQALIKPLSHSQSPEYELIGSGFECFKDGVFRISDANVQVNLGLKSSIESSNNTEALSNKGSDELDDAGDARFIIVEKSGIQEVEISGRSASKPRLRHRILDKELQFSVAKYDSPWDKAYELARALKSIDGIEFIEPDTISDIYQPSEFEDVGKRSGDYLPSYPNPESSKFQNKIDQPFVWQFEEEYSQLKPSFEKLSKSLNEPLTQAQIDELPLICHIDTGVLPEHPSLPKFFDAEKSISFTRLGNKKDSTDIDKRVALIENQGHGHGTISILAGNYMNFDQTGMKYKGYCGGFPYARVMTVKISEHVVLLSGNKFAKAIRHAIKMGASVVTMSMAGAPSRSMLKAINEAYDAGVVVVSAAGNSWVKGGRKILPKRTMYPARFNRVIGVTGATLDKTPYLVEENSDWQTREVGGGNMQTCYGPKSVSRTNIAAYTPNVQWAGDFGTELFNRSGGGTSSATPQVAAAAAMYMYVHRQALKSFSPAERVEITRQALFQSAEKSTEPKFNEVFGNGMLKARNAIAIKPSEIASNLKLERKDSLGWFISDDVFKQLFDMGKRANPNEDTRAKNQLLEKMLRTELAQLCHLDSALMEVDVDTPLERIADRVQQSELASQFLKDCLSTFLPISVPLSLRGSFNHAQSEVFLSQRLNSDHGTSVLVKAKGCGFSVKKLNVKPTETNGVTAEYELCFQLIGPRAISAPSLALSTLSEVDPGAVLVTTIDESTGQKTLRWLPAKTSGSDNLREFGLSSNGVLNLDLSTGLQPKSRGIASSLKKVIVTLYRTATDQALSDRKGLIVGQITQNGLVWLDRDSQLDKLVSEQARTLMLVHGTFSAAEAAFDSLLTDQEFLNSMMDHGCGKYV